MFKKKNLKEGQKRWNVRKERRKNLIDHRLNYRIDHTFHLFLNIRSSNYQITHSGTPFHFYCIKYPCCEQRQKLHRKIKTFHYQEVPVFVYMVGSNWKKKKSVVSKLKDKISQAEPSLPLSVCGECSSLSLLTGRSLSRLASGNFFSTLCSLTSAVNKSKPLCGTSLQSICSFLPTKMAPGLK